MKALNKIKAFSRTILQGYCYMFEILFSWIVADYHPENEGHNLTGLSYGE